MQKRAVVLFSGGLDSTTVLAIAKAEGFACYALSLNYGQRHGVELAFAESLAASMGVQQWRCAHIDLRAIGGSALTSSQPVPKPEAIQPPGPHLPSTYVPARNTIFLAHALSWAEVLGARDIFLGVSSVDYSGYPDCRPAFIEAFERLANVATAAADHGPAWRIHAPLLYWTKAETIHRGVGLGVDYAATHSCYDPSAELACGRCEACLLRRRGFAEANETDPTRYVDDSPVQS